MPRIAAELSAIQVKRLTHGMIKKLRRVERLALHVRRCIRLVVLLDCTCIVGRQQAQGT